MFAYYQLVVCEGSVFSPLQVSPMQVMKAAIVSQTIDPLAECTNYVVETDHICTTQLDKDYNKDYS